jgi:hypothetical protein
MVSALDGGEVKERRLEGCTPLWLLSRSWVMVLPAKSVSREILRLESEKFERAKRSGVLLMPPSILPRQSAKTEVLFARQG